MPWWGWIGVGALLLVAELTIVDLEFYLVFLGASALVIGLASLSGVAMPFWLEWLAFAVLAVVSLAFFRGALYAKLRPAPEGAIPEGVAGERAVADETIAPGATGSVTMRGTRWTGRNLGTAPIPAGGSCRVERTRGLELELRPEP